MRGRGFHGVFDHEKREGQEFVVDVELAVDLSLPGHTDDLADTVNYGEIGAAVLARIEGEPFDLIERLASVIAEDALRHTEVDEVAVTVHKPQAPVGVPFGDVTVRVVRRRDPVPVVIAVGERWTRRPVEHTRVGGGVSRRPEPHRLGALGPVATAVVGAVLVVALAFPVASLLYWFATGLSAGIDTERLLTSTGTTLFVAVLGAVATMALAIPIGVLVARYRSRSSAVIETATWAGHALPGIVVALALVFFGVRVAQPIYQQTPLLLIAYAVLFLPAGFGAVRSAVAMSSPRIEEVARSLGSPPLTVLRRITIPLAAPGIAAGTALVMLTIMKELPATLLLRPTGANTLATSLWTETGVAAYAAAAPYALALVLLAVLPTLWLMRAQGRFTATEDL